MDTQTPKPRTIAYLYKEICSFRNLMGMKSFWQNIKSAEIGFFAIFHLYLQTDFSSEKEETDAAVAMEALTSEYTRRYVIAARIETQPVIA